MLPLSVERRASEDSIVEPAAETASGDADEPPAALPSERALERSPGDVGADIGGVDDQDAPHERLREDVDVEARSTRRRSDRCIADRILEELGERDDEAARSCRAWIESYRKAIARGEAACGCRACPRASS